jgi:D-beta-D-heptose 7-phosphate kinase/D-beta-D-heptose 1-phosphate adenosyltransferase
MSMRRHEVDAILRASSRILVVGEMILDEFIWGKVSRISPEAPVPVVEVIRETYNAGGAANVARNLREFVDHVQMLGMVGDGPDAERLRSLLSCSGILLDGALHDPDYQTIRKTRIIARTQQVVRVDREARTPLNSEQKQKALARFDSMLKGLSAVILEDYDKGLFDQEFASAIIERANRAGVPVMVDPKPTNTIEWKSVTGLTPNRSEAFKAAGFPWSEPLDPPTKDDALLSVGDALLKKWQCQFLLVTLSEQGMILFQHGEDPYHIPTRAQEVFDVSGAGDTAIAVFTAALAGGASPREAAEISNHASGIVVGKLGTAIVSRAELLESFAE